MSLNCEQAKELSLVLDGHIVLIMGSAGTGKTFAIKTIYQELKRKKLKVAITASTGIACLQYDQAMTIHKWSGIGDGRYNPDVIRKVVANNVKFQSVCEQIKDTDVLIVDECSMVSKRMFHSLNEVCKIKNDNYLFGGIQVVFFFCGDFKQLPPVPNSFYDEDGDYCFSSAFFNEVFPHKIILSKVIRQSELPLIKAIRETADGNISPETSLLMENLKRPLSASENKIVKLYADNDLVDDYNRQCILNMSGDIHEFKSHDTGQVKYLNRLLVPKILWLKKGAPVMLLRNLSDKLVNGLRGEIVDICDGKPFIKFDSFNNPVPIEKVKFSAFSPSMNKDIAERNQYPIKLAFAMTIHKAQGLTLDRVEVDCQHIFKAGQLSVVMGRVRRIEGLRVLNFSSHYRKPQPESVSLFMDQPSKVPKEDKSCCDTCI